MINFAVPKIRTSVEVSPEFYNLCKLHGVKFSDAIRVGISLCLADRNIIEYDNNLNLLRKMNMFRIELEKKSLELDELKAKVENGQNSSN